MVCLYCVLFWFLHLGKLGAQQDWLEEWRYASVSVWGMTELVRTLQPGKRMLHSWSVQNQCEKDDWGWTAHGLFQHKLLGSSKSKQAVSKNKKGVLVHATDSRHGEGLAKVCWSCSNLQDWTGLRTDTNWGLLNRQPASGSWYPLRWKERLEKCSGGLLNMFVLFFLFP